MNHPRGIFERPNRSGVWWIRYADAQGREHREKAGTKGMALALYRKRKTEALAGKKLPESIRKRPILFSDIAAAGLEWSKDHKASWQSDVGRFKKLNSILGQRPAEQITPQELEAALRKLMAENHWAPATFNHHKNVASLAYRLAIQNGQVTINPARLVRQLRTDNGRIRFLSHEEEAELRQIIAAEFPQHMPEFDLALNTGMRAGEQYKLLHWEHVEFERRQIMLPTSKNGRPRYIPLNQPAMDALWALRQVSPTGNGRVIVNTVTPGRYHGQPRSTARNWFERAIAKAGLADFTWHCLRHTFASRLVMAGVDLRTVAELLGHRTLAMTFRYAHLAPSHQLAAVERLAAWKAETAKSTGTTTGTRDFGKSGHSIKLQLIQ